ncbi:MAG: hypothetical protein Q9219_000268 [cf. Caloplaca sp. 3 TL-2023]
MTLPPAVPTSKTPISKAPKSTYSSWPRPSKALEAEVTVRTPLCVSVKGKHSPEPTTEQAPSKNQFLPLAPLSTIVELPRQEPSESHSHPSPAEAYQASQAAGTFTPQDSDESAELRPSRLMEKEEHETRQAQEGAEAPEAISFNPADEATNIPLPRSPLSDDSAEPASPRQSIADTHRTGSARHPDPAPDVKDVESKEQIASSDGEERDTWTSKLSSILPQAMFDQSARKDTGVVDAQASRKSSFAPGSYPESDSTEEPSMPTPGPAMEDANPEIGRSQIGTSPPSGKSVRPRKSVSIALPTDKDNPEKEKRVRTYSTISDEDDSNRNAKASSNNMEDGKDGTEVKEIPKPDSMIQKEQSRQANEEMEDREGTIAKSEPDREVNQGKDHEEFANLHPQTLEVPSRLTALDSMTSGTRLNSKAASKPSQISNQQAILSASRTSSIATSHEGAHRAGESTLHERASFAPSDTDTSSLKPLLPSSPRDAHSSRFSESWDDMRSEFNSPQHGKAPEQLDRENDTHSPPIVDDSSSLTSTSSSVGSKIEETGGKRMPEYPFPQVDNGEGPSHTATSQLTPKIVVKEASEAESSMRTPSLRAPTTTPVNGGTASGRQDTFIALGEPSAHNGPIKLPMKRRKLYLRKARYRALRQPVLNAALGRQVGAQAKLALKKLAKGELIIIEPPASL